MNNVRWLKFFLFNPWSICNKTHSIMESLRDNSVDIAGICETWLREANNPITAAIKSFGYSIQHNYRKEKKGGGTALIYKSCYSLSVFRSRTDYKSFEYTAATVKTNSVSKVLFVIMYRPGQMCALFNHELDSFLSEVSSKCDTMVLAGDLNIHFDQLGNKLYKQSLDILQSYGMQRQIFEPTHIGGGSLDQIFTFNLNSQLECVTRVDSSGLLGSDHFPVYCNMKLAFEKKFFKDIKYRSLKEIVPELFSKDLTSVINMLSLTGSFGTAIKQLSAKTSDIVDLHAPLVTKRISVVAKAPWFDKEYRKLRTLRRKAEKVWRKTRSESERLIYKDLCTECSEMARDK